MVANQIKEKKYSIKEAIDMVPSGQLQETKKDLAKILGLVNHAAVWYYITGKSQPTLSKAKMVEEYFDTKFGIKDVWKAID